MNNILEQRDRAPKGCPKHSRGIQKEESITLLVIVDYSRLLKRLYSTIFFLFVEKVPILVFLLEVRILTLI